MQRSLPLSTVHTFVCRLVNECNYIRQFVRSTAVLTSCLTSEDNCRTATGHDFHAIYMARASTYFIIIIFIYFKASHDGLLDLV